MVRPSPKLRHGDGEPESSLAPSKKRNRGGGASRAAVEPHDLKRSARKIYDYLVRILSSDTKQHTEEINDLPEDFDGIKWYRVFDVDEAYSANGLLGDAWSPERLNNRGKVWCFTVRELLGNDGRVKRVTADRTTKWYNTRGKHTMNSYMSDLNVCSLVTLDPIQGRHFRMTEVTLNGINTVVALCKIKKDTQAPPASLIGPRAEEPEKVDGIDINTTMDEAHKACDLDLKNEACNTHNDINAWNHNRDQAIQHGLNVGASNMDPVITASTTNKDLPIQLGLNIGANNMDPVITTSIYSLPCLGANKDLAIQHGLNVNANNMDAVTTASTTNKDQAIQLGLNVGANNMDPLATASMTNEGSTGSMRNNISSKFLEDVWKVWTHKEVFPYIYSCDEDTAAHMASQMAQIGSIMENYQSSTGNTSQEDGENCIRDEPKQLFKL